MGCHGCSTGSPSGCGNKGNCATGGCNRLNTFDWLTHLEVADTEPVGIVEVSFKNGASKSFYRVSDHLDVFTGDMVAVEAQNGYNVGQISLSGELVRLQMKKKRVQPKHVKHQVLRRAHERDLERLAEARDLERETMVRSRAIARSLGLDMKIGDVEYQGDKRKATFFYTAKGRVDFRQLIRELARAFRIKIEMRQIGSRQESSRIGGIGSCGRELCCSTWLTDFKSVTTSAARYQNLAINQSKLSGQCGRLKCCLNYELDTYVEALTAFPRKVDRLPTELGTAVLVKTDIFKKVMYYAYQKGPERGKLYPLTIDQVKELVAKKRTGEKIASLQSLVTYHEPTSEAVEEQFGYEDVTGAVELPVEKKNKKKKKRRKKHRNSSTAEKEKSNKKQKKNPDQGGDNSGPEANSKGKQGGKRRGRGRNRRRNRNRNKGGGKKSE
jgi:cell fate regulator YaaT (PSP1 superfamily)